jgi:hypothetical protein
MADPETTSELAPGLWSWARRHPEWHPGDFGAEVVSFMAVAGEETLLVDPLLDDDDPAWELITGSGSGPIRVLITITYHVRSAEPVRDRFAPDREVTIHGHPAVAARLASSASFHPFTPGDELPAGVSAHPIGKPRRYETPLLLPSHRALVFADAVAGTDQGPRIWSGEKVDGRVARFYSERFVPTLLPLLDLDFDRLLLTHGPSVLSDGKAGLREAIDAPVWYHRG